MFKRTSATPCLGGLLGGSGGLLGSVGKLTGSLTSQLTGALNLVGKS